MSELNQERIALAKRVYALSDKVARPKPRDMTPNEWDLLADQLYHMREYLNILTIRKINAGDK